MEREQVIKKTMFKLAMKKEIILSNIEDLKNLYRKHKKMPYKDKSFPENILKFIGNFMDKNPLDQNDKLLFLAEAKKNNLFDFSLNQNLEKAWRLILKKWKLTHYKLEEGLIAD